MVWVFSFILLANLLKEPTTPQMTTSRNAACPCGSGKKFKRCCANTPTASAPTKNPVDEGLQALTSKQFHQALSCFQQAVERSPNNSKNHYFLGLALQGLGELEKAKTEMQQAFAAGLSDPAALFQYGHLLIRLGFASEAAVQFSRAVAKKPDFLQARLALANSYYEAEQFLDAMKHYKLLSQALPDEWSVHFNFAQTCYRLGKYTTATKQFHEALCIRPNDITTLAHLAGAQEHAHKLKEAKETALMAIALAPSNTEARVTLARIARRNGDYAQSASHLTAGAPPENSRDTSALFYWQEQGKVQEKLGNYDTAFYSYQHSNEIAAAIKHIQYDASSLFSQLDGQEGLAVTPVLQELLHHTAQKGDGTNDLQPAFITGFSRTGSTLIEQMISSHPEVIAGGEMTAIEEAEQQISKQLKAPWPSCLTTDPIKQVISTLRKAKRRAQQNYKVAANRSKERWILDKHPFNAHRLLLIHLLFPSSPVIHCIRHPLDVALSTYFTNFIEGNAWSYDLLDTSQLLARTHQHIERLSTALALPTCPIRYESLVEDSRSNIQKILDRLDLPWNDACEEYHKNKRIANTASYEQVARPLYRESLYRHEKFTANISDEVIDSVRGLAKKLGYAVPNRK